MAKLAGLIARNRKVAERLISDRYLATSYRERRNQKDLNFRQRQEQQHVCLVYITYRSSANVCGKLLIIDE